MKKLMKISTCLLLFSSIACDDVVEENIEDDIVVATYPTQGTIITGNAVTFEWENLEGADDYRVQIFSEGTQTSVLDSLVEGQNTLTYVMNPGNFSWRVRGENFAYVTAYNFPIDFEVQASDDLTNQIINIITPSSNYFTNNVSNVIVTWDAITNADSYTFEMNKTVNNTTTTEIQESGLTTTSYSVASAAFNEDGIYTLKVKGLNSNNSTETVFSTRLLSLDTQAPNDIGLVSPNEAATVNVSTTVNFSWNIPTDSGTVQSPITYQLELSNDDTFASVFGPTGGTTNTATYSFSTVGTYYWRIKATDEAGNSTISSTNRSIVVQ